MKTKFKEYSWNDFDRDIGALSIEILKHYQPDVIVALVRGGSVPAIKLSHLLDIRVEFYEPKDNLYKDDPLMSIINEYNKKLLFVDEIVDTGKTVFNLNKNLKSIGYPIQNYKFASLLYYTDALKYPDYYVHELNRDEQINTWWVFPWEKTNQLEIK